MIRDIIITNGNYIEKTQLNHLKNKKKIYKGYKLNLIVTIIFLITYKKKHIAFFGKKTIMEINSETSTIQ